MSATVFSYPKGSLKLSPHFTYAEGIVTTHKNVPNVPDNETLAAMGRTAMCMESVRELLGNNPITVTSWFRSPELNKVIGGSPTSQHSLGEAVDFFCPGFGNAAQITQKLLDNAEGLRYDQLIQYDAHVHISFITHRKDPRPQPRMQYIDSRGNA